jgi:hypothetical protein
MKVDILVSTCSAYKDTWPTLASGFERCAIADKFKISCICTGVDDAAHMPKGWVPILLNKDLGWSDNILHALKQVSGEYVLLWLDDIIPVSSPEESLEVFIREAISNLNPVYLRLSPKPKGQRMVSMVGGRAVYDLPKNMPYRNSTILALWQKSHLASILRGGESAWQFEINGTERSAAIDGFFCINQPIVKTANLIVKGKIEPASLAKVREFQLEYKSTREEIRGVALCKLRLKEYLHSVATLLMPPSVFKVIQKILS